MRHKLSAEEGQRKRYIATFSRVGKKRNFKGYSEDTILLVDVRDGNTNEKVCDHVWFTFSKAFEQIRFEEGMQISFEARVKEYKKGYVNRSLNVNRSKKDFKLSHPTKVEKL
jgi:hypothetical protein